MKTLAKFFSLTTALVVLSLLAPALRAQDAAKDTATNYWPFKVGNTWTMTTKSGDNEMDLVFTVTKIVPNGAASDAYIEYKAGDNVVQTEIYRFDDKGISRVASGKDSSNVITPPFPVVLYPMAGDKKWPWTGTLAVNGKSINGKSDTTTSAAETLKLPAGEFKAIRVHVDLTMTGDGDEKVKIVNDYWFAPGVGMVQQKVTIGETVISGVLKSYKLN